MTNAHLISIRYVPPTETKSARIILASEHFDRDSITDGYPGMIADILAHGHKMLGLLGYTVLCFGTRETDCWFAVKEVTRVKEARETFLAKKPKAPKVLIA